MVWPLNPLACHVVRASFRVFRRPVPNLFAVYLPKRGRVRVALPNGGTVRLWSMGDDWVANRLFWYGFEGYEPETTRVFLDLAARAEVVLDVGAHVGYYSLLAAAANPSAVVFAFEPLPQVQLRLRRNLALNGDRVRHVALAVGERRGRAPFFHVPDGVPSSSSLSGEFMSQIPNVVTTEVEMVDLDSFLAEHTEGRVDLVKIDTEATEPQVLAGMPEVLRTARPTIVCEVLPDQGVEEPLERVLAAHGYTWSLLTEHGPEARAAIVGQLDDRNWLFSPPIDDR